MYILYRHIVYVIGILITLHMMLSHHAVGPVPAVEVGQARLLHNYI